MHELQCHCIIVHIAGHSLGGALAMLAAYDIAAAFTDMEVSCYTFGSPRYLLDCLYPTLH